MKRPMLAISATMRGFGSIGRYTKRSINAPIRPATIIAPITATTRFPARL